MQHEERKKEIIGTALSEWSKTLFNNTSLSSLANKLGITKTGLYRYFRNKDELEDAIEERVIEAYTGIGQTFLKGLSKSSIEDTLMTYVETFFTFFSNHIEYFLFFLHQQLHKPFLGSPKIENFQTKAEKLFSQLLKDSGIDWKPRETAKIGRLITTTALFWLHRFLQKNRKSGSGQFHGRSFLPDEIKRFTRSVYEMLLNGFSGEKFCHPPSFSKIEEQCTVTPEEMPEENKIFKAIGDVISEVGLDSTSLDKIAVRAGMTKSSLYFYFKNKGEMLQSMIESEQAGLHEIFLRKVVLFETFEEKLYCLIIVSASFLFHRKSMLAALIWIKLQGIDHEPEYMDNHQFDLAKDIEEAIKMEKIDTHGMDIQSILSCLNLLILNEIITLSRLDPEKTLVLKDMRIIYRFFTDGVLRSNS